MDVRQSQSGNHVLGDEEEGGRQVQPSSLRASGQGRDRHAKAPARRDR